MPYKDPIKAKEHARLRTRKYRLRGEIQEKEREKRKERYTKNPEKEKLYYQEYIKKNPQKYKARYTLNNAIRRKAIIKNACAFCGKTINIHAHHKDYNSPTVIVWLCAKCHMKEDKCLPLSIDFPMGLKFPQLLQ